MLIVRVCVRLGRKRDNKRAFTQALSAYGDFCRRVMAYEKDAFDGWLRDAVDTEARQMRRGSLLVFRDDKLASTFDVSASAPRRERRPFPSARRR